MTRYALILIIVAACAAGCTPTYTVHVNTFSQIKEPLSPAASIYVATDPNSRNPILAERIAAKIRTLLQERGYTPVEKAEGARYALTFRAGVDSTRYLDYMPVSRPFGYYGYGGFYRGFGYGYTTYVPYIETVYANWMEMRLYNQGENTKERPQPIWIGEGIVGTDEPDLRRAVNYLLLGLMQYFGADTERWVSIRIKANDPRVQALGETP
jgi:hypothetical protein